MREGGNHAAAAARRVTHPLQDDAGALHVADERDDGETLAVGHLRDLVELVHQLVQLLLGVVVLEDLLGVEGQRHGDLGGLRWGWGEGAVVGPDRGGCGLLLGGL
jgi:hypothetical protein